MVSDSDSEAESDIMEYINSQKEKRDRGENVTNEEFWFDSENDVVRNLHRESHSLTSYDHTKDGRLFGRNQLLQDLLTKEERRSKWNNLSIRKNSSLLRFVL